MLTNQGNQIFFVTVDENGVLGIEDSLAAARQMMLRGTKTKYFLLTPNGDKPQMSELPFKLNDLNWIAKHYGVTG